MLGLLSKVVGVPLWGYSLKVFTFVIVFVFVCVFLLVRSCLLITMSDQMSQRSQISRAVL